MKMNSRGQSLIFLLVLLPVLVTAVGLLLRVGTLMVRHDQIENHCNKKVLDALAIEGRALKSLGKINPVARIVIQTRRVIDAMIVLTAPVPVLEAELLAARRVLQTTQKVIASTQKGLIRGGAIARGAKLLPLTPREFAGKISELYGPFRTDLSLEAEPSFEGETGAPLQPSENFTEREKAWGRIAIYSEKFVWPWQSAPSRSLPKKFSNMLLRCQAEFKLTRLEEPWTIELTPVPEGRLSWNAP